MFRHSIFTHICLFFCYIFITGLCSIPILSTLPIPAIAASRSHEQGKSDASRTIPPHLTAKRKHTIESDSDRYSLYIEYPSLGIPKIDNEIALWAVTRGDTFAQGVEAFPESDTSRLSLLISFELTQIAENCVSFIYYITTETGNEYAEQGLATFTYNLKTLSRLRYQDVFKRPHGLIPFFSGYCYRELSKKPFAVESAKQVHDGTRPDALNFSFFTLSPEGITLYFPPQQVASDAYGIQKITIPLQELAPFEPDLSLW